MTAVDSPEAATALTSRPSSLRRIRFDLGTLCGLTVALVGLSIGGRRLGDNSFFTHLATGRETLDNGFVREDVFTWTSAGDPVVVQSWLASVAYAVADDVGGLGAVRALMAATAGALAVLAWILTRRSEALVVRVAVMAPVLYLGLRLWTERPLLLGLLMFATLSVVVEKDRPTRWLVLVGALWVGVHGSWPLGLVLLAATAVGARLDGDSDGMGAIRRSAGWFGLGVAVAGVLNPYGPRLLVFPLELLGKQETLGLVAEWQSPRFDSLWTRTFLVLVILAIVAVARRARWRLTLPMVVFVAAALVSRRNMAVAVIALTPVLAYGLPGPAELLRAVEGRWRIPVSSLDAASRLHERHTSPAIRLATMALGVLIIAIPLVGLRGPHMDLNGYPVEAVNVLDQRGYMSGNTRIVHPDYVGNYLGLRYRSPVAWFDDRYEVHDSALIEDYVTLLRGRSGWREVLERWNAEVLVWPATSSLGDLVVSDAGWVGIYEDEDWAVLCNPAAIACR